MFTDRGSKHVLERGYARPQVSDLHPFGRRQNKQIARTAITGHEDAHHVLVGRQALEAGRPQSIQECVRPSHRRLHAQFVDPP